MTDNLYTLEKELPDVKVERPHVVLLGAGASYAAFPEGDRNGIRLPVMANFVDTLGLKEDLVNAGINGPFNDFEALYSDIHIQQPDFARKLEEKIYNYFSQLQLPDSPTIYDYLILSLREKDVIATFNWDPLLPQAAVRISSLNLGIRMPEILFLHGNVGMKHCPNCKSQFPLVLPCCPGCRTHKGERFKLLYPIKKKNYSASSAIERQWGRLEEKLKQALFVSIFGYGAPISDIDAINQLKQAWGEKEDRNLEQYELIDIAEREEVEKRWEQFIHTHHSEYVTDFFDSRIARHPRRSCESMVAQFFMNLWQDETSRPPMFATVNELADWMYERISYE
ncbi:hypothetical protein [Halodesulfovibrio sp.]|jgi:NAD-dependent SIR2 family protein deacetylase|uniref:hypothetical protein n=1 Tax=Halodesulfovibrio sp. TaxID=1912772 RepID=UPI0025F67BAA|nr:hypothetical protein [Halodesulfovibrio sp.]MCT4627722.1 hypothetical protein [Halodesulfovibrio sp.]